MIFKTIQTIHWESEDGRFVIREAVPSGFCAQDTESDWIEGFGYSKFVFTSTLDDAMSWCLDRVS